MPDMDSSLQSFNQVVCGGGWTSLFPALDDLCQATIGHRLFSCSAFRMTGAQSGVAARIYTSDTRNYPVSGEKEIVPNRWTEIVIARRQIFVANSAEEFTDVFPDHALIKALGLGSVINIPVFLRGEFIGTVNMLHRAGYYSAEHIARVPSLSLAMLLAFELSAE